MLEPEDFQSTSVNASDPIVSAGQFRPASHRVFDQKLLDIHDAFLETLPFQLDDFQQGAMDTLIEGDNVVVSAPTGSGKTLIATYALALALRSGKRAFYTTPLKALSNQKFHEFKQQFGDENVGLLTGDTAIRRDAPIVVMTTEIFRNMLYSVQSPEAAAETLGPLAYVVLDECHYMNDSQRGTVWEESIIYCPSSVQIVALSATIANGQELTDWMSTVHRETRLIETNYRPVPLRFLYYDRRQILPLFEAPGQMNRKLKFEEKNRQLAKQDRQLDPGHLVQSLAEKELLPAIVFVFSRSGCERALKQVGRQSLLSKAEHAEVERRMTRFLEQYPFLTKHPQLAYIRQGLASHHAGLLPALKQFVESLFQDNLIKVVFATETLAAGVNMPARATVITALSKRSDVGFRTLTASEFLQMSGRAGRRGMDTLGYVVTVSSRFESAQDIARLASSPSDPLNSQFSPNYGMVLNLLQRFDVASCQFLIEKSFGQFTWERRMAPVFDTLCGHQDRYHELALRFQRFKTTEDEFSQWQHVQRQIDDQRRLVKTYRNQLKRYGRTDDMVLAHQQSQDALKALETKLAESPSGVQALLKKHPNLLDKLKRAQREVKHWQQYYENEKNVYWRQFMAIYRILKQHDYLSEEDHPTLKGLLTSQMRTENPLFMTEVLLHVERASIEGFKFTPGSLSALVFALTFDYSKDSVYSQLDYDPALVDLFKAIKGIAKDVRQWQKAENIEINIPLNTGLAGLAQGWTEGLSWERLRQHTNLDEGDLVRAFRRTMDVLKQIGRLEGLDSGLTEMARQAAHAMQRDPVREVDLDFVEPTTDALDTPENLPGTDSVPED